MPLLQAQHSYSFQEVETEPHFKALRFPKIQEICPKFESVMGREAAAPPGREEGLCGSGSSTISGVQTDLGFAL
ncbi:hypothetical protein AAFF_G00149570 [Aldrovandia affinis]|uniref:Uncharacterized protein n=1 Tax=Aldrovandia affinis TaxID=143900 RepID=A0AAD7W8X2_9TELE|nr:hypothetical protein AAFF_G00149570 [Aldrovandia affinis]